MRPATARTGRAAAACDARPMRVSAIAMTMLASLACGSAATPGPSSPADATTDGASDGATDATTDGATTDTAIGHDAATGDASAGETTINDAGLAPVLEVVGNHLVGVDGKTLRLHGVNHSGSEYACVGGAAGTGYDTAELPAGTSLTDFAKAIASWKSNVVRLPVNEDCWLGINGLDPTYSGASYRSAVQAIVAAIRAQGMFVIFDLHWAAPSTHVPREQWPMADADHAADFWTSAATTFKGDVGVLFDMFNEPFVDSTYTTDPWSCLKNGCSVTFASKDGSVVYQTIGTQKLLDAIRATGSRNVVLVPGLGYTGDLSGWLANEPTDATGQHVASLHNYAFTGCTDATCWASSFGPVAAKVPLLTGEIGDGKTCGGDYVNAYLTWADGVGASYLGWTWNTWDCVTGPSLITAYDGTPTAMGQAFKAHYAATF
ncbi:MAG: cellulase family glycosylhydrolase [Polyangiales bacterium]